MTIRTLVLSGGGGRGAFHAGVYNYLSEIGWQPEIIVGTSIGAVNGAAITQGIDAQTLEAFWLALREHHIQGLPPGMRALSRWAANRVLKQLIGVTLPRVPREHSTSPAAQETWPPLPLLPLRLSEALIGRWNNLLDTGPLRQTLTQPLKRDPEAINHSDTTLIINATNVRTGEQATFCNQAIVNPKTGQLRQDVEAGGITINRILASCSIPLVYPWTEDGGQVYWDGAVVANTAMGAAFDATHTLKRPIDEPMEIIVVMMTPWWEPGAEVPSRRQHLPRDFGEAITWTLDWALLASFREQLKLTKFCNRMGQKQAQTGEPVTYRHAVVRIVAPLDFMDVQRIIDYDTASAGLIQEGYEAAVHAFQIAPQVG